jgi:hypothetical protein
MVEILSNGIAAAETASRPGQWKCTDRGGRRCTKLFDIRKRREPLL